MGELKIGTLVDYWRGAREGAPSGRGRTRSEVQKLCGRDVVWIEGCAGCIDLTHVQPVLEPRKTQVRRVGAVARKGEP